MLNGRQDSWAGLGFLGFLGADSRTARPQSGMTGIIGITPRMISFDDRSFGYPYYSIVFDSAIRG